MSLELDVCLRAVLFYVEQRTQYALFFFSFWFVLNKPVMVCVRVEVRFISFYPFRQITSCMEDDKNKSLKL